MDFKNLKRNSDFDKIKKQIESTQSGGNKEDSRFWSPTVDKAGNGMAIIRWLPTALADGDGGIPWVCTWKHGFQEMGGWLIEDCPTTYESDCPVCESNTILWNSGLESNKDIARKRKRKLTYISNIYVVSDPSFPENDGQIKLFKYGAKIYVKLQEAMNPPFPDKQPINPFDLWKGANFKLKMRQVDGYRNYDLSEFESPAPLGDDAKLESIWRSEYSLKEFTDPTKFKSYKDIKTDKTLIPSGSVH